MLEHYISQGNWTINTRAEIIIQIRYLWGLAETRWTDTGRIVKA